MRHLPRSLAALLALVVLISTLWAGTLNAAEPRVHVVSSGQRLGSIAKRYNVSIEAICNANGIRRSDVLRPGQKLTIPDRSDTSGSKARARAESNHKAPPDPPAETKEPAPEKRAPHAPVASDALVHVVASGQRLGSIAKRYRVNIDALCQANDIRRNDRIRPGQKLVIPGVFVAKSAVARDAKQGQPSAKTKARSRSWYRYRQKPRRPGYVTLVGYHGQWSGYLVGKGRRVIPGARRAISKVMAWPREKALMDVRLLGLLAQVSDEFGGRSVRLISGWRNTSFARESRHKHGRAMDFMIPGVPNEALRDYLRSLENVGVGYYPNSTFVHLDTRETSAFWTDYAGPGEPPRYRRAGTESSQDDADTETGNADADDGTATQGDANDAERADTKGADTKGAEQQAPEKQRTRESTASAK